MIGYSDGGLQTIRNTRYIEVKIGYPRARISFYEFLIQLTRAYARIFFQQFDCSERLQFVEVNNNNWFYLATN